MTVEPLPVVVRVWYDKYGRRREERIVVWTTKEVEVPHD